VRASHFGPLAGFVVPTIVIGYGFVIRSPLRDRGAAREVRAVQRPTFVARQAGNPSGILGRLIAWIMERETAAPNAQAIAALAPGPGDRVLEVGFAHGRTIEELARLTPRGFVAGIDHAPEMVELASRRCARLIAEGRVDLKCADSRTLPFADRSFDKVLAVHTVYFWSEPAIHLREIARVLQPDGVAVLGFRPASDPGCRDFPASVYTFYEPAELIALLDGAGFAGVTTDERTPGFVVARAVRRADCG
jgi:SAM-dependent methyltransferase